MFCNLEKTSCCPVKKIYEPKSLSELRQIVKLVLSKNESLSLFGSRHSYSEIVCPSRHMIDTKGLNKILKVCGNNVTVEAGMLVSDLNYQLASKYNLELLNQIFIGDVTIVGLISTGGHGTGRNASFSDMVVSINFLDQTGKMHHVTKKDAEVFNAIRTNIGIIGVIYSVEIKCRKLSKIHYARRLTTLNTILPIYKKLNKIFEHFQFIWNPFTDNVLVYIWTYNEKKFLPKYNDFVQKDFVDRQLQTLGNHDAIDMTSQSLMFSGIVIPGFPLIDTEYFAQIDLLPGILKDIKKIYQKYFSEDELFLPPLIRFIPPSNAYMNMSYGRETVCFNLATYGYEQYIDFYKEIDDIMVRKWNARPHWAKIFYLTASEVRELYPKTENFKEVIKKYNSKKLIGSSAVHELFR